MSGIEREPPAMAVFRRLSTERSASSLVGMKFKNFRHLGLAILADKRLDSLCLLRGAKGSQLRSDAHLFTWESIVPANEVAGIKAKLDDEEDLYREALDPYYLNIAYETTLSVLENGPCVEEVLVRDRIRQMKSTEVCRLALDHLSQCLSNHSECPKPAQARLFPARVIDCAD
ncbi:hypothetical protein PT974_03103 [Cladobotryum mycophilum]|uniref:Uncharacterized protein n=1 Tax=Cladobotryum mycophilum TaxID=491253 RepID=A0ABR0SRB2_9HYPO